MLSFQPNSDWPWSVLNTGPYWVVYSVRVTGTSEPSGCNVCTVTSFDSIFTGWPSTR